MTADELHDALHDTLAARGNPTSVDRRVTVLETRFDTMLTMLPNKADLADLKAELKSDIHGEAARLSKWAAATAITMVIGFASMILAVMGHLPHG